MMILFIALFLIEGVVCFYLLNNEEKRYNRLHQKYADVRQENRELHKVISDIKATISYKNEEV